MTTENANLTPAMESETESGPAATSQDALFFQSGRHELNVRPLGPKPRSYLTRKSQSRAALRRKVLNTPTQDDAPPRDRRAPGSGARASNGATTVSRTPSNDDYPTLRERIRSYVNIVGDCWLWTGAEKTKGRGYGGLFFGGKLHFAHRLAYQAFNERRIPRGKFILHRCDDPRCVNPAHLFVGTLSDNMRDCAAKGRLARQKNPALVCGTRNPAAKLTPEQVEFIRDARAKRVKCKVLAAQFGVSKCQIGRIGRGDRWAAPGADPRRAERNAPVAPMLLTDQRKASAA